MGCCPSSANEIEPVKSQSKTEIDQEQNHKNDSYFVHEDNGDQDVLPLMQTKSNNFLPDSISEGSSDIDQDLINKLLAECEEQSDNH